MRFWQSTPTLALLALAGCKGGDPRAMQEVEKAARALGDQVDVVDQVQCRGDAPVAAGARIECAVAFVGGTQQDAIVEVSAGATPEQHKLDAHWKKIPVGARTRVALGEAIGKDLGTPASLDCGAGKVDTLIVGQKLRCTVKISDGTEDVHVWYDDALALHWAPALEGGQLAPVKAWVAQHGPAPAEAAPVAPAPSEKAPVPGVKPAKAAGKAPAARPAPAKPAPAKPAPAKPDAPAPAAKPASAPAAKPAPAK